MTILNIIFSVLGFFALAFITFGVFCCIYVGAEADMTPEEKAMFRKKRKRNDTKKRTKS